jgi:hypothetical protein
VFTGIPITLSGGRNASERVAEPVIAGRMPIVLFSLAQLPQFCVPPKSAMDSNGHLIQ